MLVTDKKKQIIHCYYFEKYWVFDFRVILNHEISLTLISLYIIYLFNESVCKVCVCVKMHIYNQQSTFLFLFPIKIQIVQHY